jgi:uncharacterized protein (DUF488 family)
MDRSAGVLHVAHPFYTIGHSTRAIREFVELLRAHRIKRVIDVRTIPRSRTNAQYNSIEFAESLTGFQIDYQHIKALGGLRGRKLDVPREANAFWKNQSFHNYADYALSPEFRFGLEQLRALGHATICAIMCAEAVWWRCHRRIIADHLIASGETVFHILGPNSVDLAQLTKGARVGANGVVSYPPLADSCSNKNLAAKR